MVLSGKVGDIRACVTLLSAQHGTAVLVMHDGITSFLFVPVSLETVRRLCGVEALVVLLLTFISEVF